MRVNIIIEDAVVEKNNKWIKFTVITDTDERPFTHTMEFCGSELHTSFALPDELLEKLREKLKEDFGSSDYDSAIVKAKIKKLSYNIF